LVGGVCGAGEFSADHPNRGSDQHTAGMAERAYRSVNRGLVGTCHALCTLQILALTTMIGSSRLVKVYGSDDDFLGIPTGKLWEVKCEENIVGGVG